MLFISVVYLACTMGLGTVSVCLTVLTLNLHHRDPERKVPRWAKVLILNYLTRILCVQSRKPKSRREHVYLDSKQDGISIKGGLRKIVNDSHILSPMLQNSTLDLEKFPTTRPDPLFQNSTSNNHNSNNTDGRSYCNHCGSQNTGEVPKRSENNDWRELAHVLDRLFFWLVFMFMSASTMIIMFVPFYKEVKKLSWSKQQVLIWKQKFDVFCCNKWWWSQRNM